MPTPANTERYKKHRFPDEIISHGVWLYYRFCLNYRDVGELLFVRGVIVTYEAIRKWCRKFGQQYANQLRRRRPRPGDKWHLDEVFLTINGELHDLWWAVDQEGNVLDILVRSRRNKQAAKKLFRQLLKGLTYVPRVIITDKLKSYGAAKWEVLPGVEHRQHRYLNNRAENSHQPTHQREWRMQGFESPGQADFSPRMGQLPNTFAHVGIDWPRSHTGKRCGKDSPPGRTSRIFPLLHKGRNQGGYAPPCQMITLTCNKLTTPSRPQCFASCDSRNSF